MKPTLEKISPDFGSSLLVKQHTKKRKNQRAFWHFHPELELVYVNKGQGKRHIGNHLAYFNNSQLILIGENLPHNGFADRLTERGTETIVQFKSDFLGKAFFDMPEMIEIKKLFEKAKKGILYKPRTKQLLGSRIEGLLDLKGVARITELLDILQELAETDDYTLLNVDGFAFETNQQDSNRIDTVFNYVNQHFKEHISLDDIADEVSMTVPAFCRYFKKSTGKTFTQLVNEYRVVHATKLLSETEKSVTDVCYECGFNNFSHFNKIFKEFTGKNASKYRNEIKNLVKQPITV